MRETTATISKEAVINISTYVSSSCAWDASESVLSWGVPAIWSPSPSSIVAGLYNMFYVNVNVFLIYIYEPFPFPCGRGLSS